ncbi:type II toxin-antitoxin system CcdA family antitoxin [Breoghania sp. L-A4]|uniref:type II toxin-antitoxin system CcdA family antitoxin n=1 Tax=Breoghania sp. L-A4 TaxID=2304600 RepID=UPI000E36012D|nr:type II toxin-antitoxin system CcdA family antitoxin [Breoghania sp. L-A4]AXS40837.1 hypothetical protein D1F64_13270 [Breoghania sp. L-A4]
MNRKIASVEVSEELLLRAEAAGIDVSQAVEEALQIRLEAVARRDAWAEENREGLESYRRYIEAHGTMGERLKHLRRF